MLIGLGLCASAMACLLGRAVVAGVPGATLGLAGVASTWWLIAVVLCGTLAAVALLVAPSLREDVGPGGGQVARDSWRWAATSALAAVVMGVAHDVGLGFVVIPGVADGRAWLAVVLLVNAGVVTWLLPLLSGWTPEVRRQMVSSPKGLFD